MPRDTTAPELTTTGAGDDDDEIQPSVPHPADARCPEESRRLRVLEALARFARRQERDR